MKLTNLHLWLSEQGQDLTEYTLVMAFVALMAASVFIAAGGSTRNIWSSANSQLAAANTTAAGTGTAATPTSPSTPPSTGQQQPDHDGRHEYR